MGRGRRFDGEPKLNLKKVFAVIIAIVVLGMFVYAIKWFLNKDDITGKITSKSYLAVFKDNKWGVIDSTAKEIIAPSYGEMIIIPNNKVGVFICTYDVDYETGEYKTKVLNEKNSEIFTEYEKVEALNNMDKDSNLIYDQQVLKVKNNGKYGLINMEGKLLVPTEYDNIETISKIENTYKLTKDGKVGIANSDGRLVIEPQYIDIDVLGKDNKSGFIVKNESNKYGIVSYSNTAILPINYDSVEKIYGNNCYVVTVAGKQKLVNKDGADVLTTGFEKISQILNGQENEVIFINANKYGIMKLTGETTLEAQYDYLEETKTDIFIAKQGDKYGIINSAKEEKIPFSYKSISYNSKADIYVLEDDNYNNTILNGNLETKLTGMLIELNEIKGYIKLKSGENYKYYNLKFEEKQESEVFPNRTLFITKQDGKYGFADKEGKIVVECIYDDAVEQNDYGFAAIKKDGKWGSIDLKGVVIQEPTYNLDNYLLIDFIGRWHYGQDINMNYYNQF